MKKMRKLMNAIIAMAMVLTKRVIAVLDFPREIDEFAAYAESVRQSMLAAPYFSASATLLGTLGTNVVALAAAQTGLHASPPTVTTAERDAILLTVQNNLRSLRSDVQVLADADHANAATIIESANMKVKQAGAINKQDFEARRGKVSETAELIAKGLTGRYANEWAMSQDGTNWIYITTTLSAKTIISGLAKGSIWDFRHRYILKDGPSDWLYFDGLVIV